ncbi:IS66 family transposase [Iocasia frigidifontis]|uniref:IS66 family transposase n=1 Tax=Iocasia fonsfrigidae TaxID=2682810 RepID=UPI001E39598D|nr:IS66 family transposase [Iocasia fonsfrigidae]
MKTTDKSTTIQVNKEENQELSLEDKIAIQAQQIEELTAKLNWYEEQFRLNQQRRFGASSEKSNSNQLSIFNEAEQEAKVSLKEAELEEITYKRRKGKNKKKKSFEDLPVEVIEYHLDEAEQICPQCGKQLHVMSKEIRKELKIIPAQVKVVEHVRDVYACRNCEKENITTPVITAPMPNPVLKGSFLSPSLLAYIMDTKYSQAVPLYRQEKQFKNFGIELSRQNLANWVIHGANNWLNYLYDRIYEYLLKEDIVHADETTLQVLSEKGKAAKSKSYMWLYATGVSSPPIYLYEYQPSRANEHPKKFLTGFSGFLQTDGYAGYNSVQNVTQLGCFAHARRGFTDALKALPKGSVHLKTNAEEGLNFCNRLFQIERDLKDLSAEERYQKRLEQSKPVLEAFLSWLKIKEQQTLPKSGLSKAIKYCLNQWPKLEAFLLDGRLEISNNRAERAIKPFVIGRKNFLFSKSVKGATASAITYSIIETAKANNLVPFFYLKYLFEKLPNIDLQNIEQLDELLPWSQSIPEECRIPHKN